MSGAGAGARPLRVAYVVSRFPLVTETFVVRELDGVAACDGVEVELFALFGGDAAVVHPQARPWLAHVRRASARRAPGALAAWAAEAPWATARVLGRVLRDHAASPRRLVRALATTVLAFDLARAMRELGVDHVHAHFATYPALTAWVAHRLLGVPYSVTAHAHDVFVDQTGLRTRLRDAAAVVAISGYHWRFLQHFGAAATRLHRIGCGIDLGEYGFRPRELPDAGPVDALVVGSFRAYKGQLVLLAALAEGGDALERVRVEFVGDGPLRAEAQALAARLGLGARCTFSGARDARYVRPRLDEAHLLVQPSRVQADGDTEGLPTTLVEAAATGVLAVATCVAGVPELLADGVSGHVALPDAPADLAAALERALTTRPARPLQEEARRRVEERHDLHRVAPQLVAMFRAAVGEGLAGHGARRA